MGVRSVRLVAGLLTAAVSAASAQTGTQQPTTKLLLLPLQVKTAADSAASIALMDAVRAKVGQSARYKAYVVPKAKLCEALKASDFACDVLLDQSQASLLARFLNVNAYSTGTFERGGGTMTARVRLVDIGSSGYAALITASAANPGTPAGLTDQVAQRVNVIIRAGELARECNDKRQKGQLSQALESARKALQLEPNLTAAHLCIGTIYEAQRMPLDSQLAAAQRATKGDSLNATAWETVARIWQMKGDTLKAVDAFSHELAGEPHNTNLRLGIAELLRQHKQYPQAVAALDEGLQRAPGEQKFLDLKSRVCIEGELWRCVLDGFTAKAQADSSVLGDSTFLKAAIGAAQALPDTGRLVFFSRAAAHRFAQSAPFWKAHGAAHAMAGRSDSSAWAYKHAVALDPNDVASALLVAQAIVEGAVYDTARARQLQEAKDTVGLHGLRAAFAAQLDSAKTYLDRVTTSPDTALQINAAVILLQGGSKLAQAQAYDRAYPWLDQTLQVVAPRTPTDSVGPRHQIRVQASFWYGIASVATLHTPYGEMLKSKSCTDAKAVYERIGRAKDALVLGSRVHAPTVNTMLQNLAQYENQMPKVKQAFKCRNF
jgi:tetratricopeptide (TPR) repeat protein